MFKTTTILIITISSLIRIDFFLDFLVGAVREGSGMKGLCRRWEPLNIYCVTSFKIGCGSAFFQDIVELLKPKNLISLFVFPSASFCPFLLSNSMCILVINFCCQVIILRSCLLGILLSSLPFSFYRDTLVFRHKLHLRMNRQQKDRLDI